MVEPAGQSRPRAPLRVLAGAHFLVGFLLLPVSLAFGAVLAPLMALGPLWIVALGVLLWRPSVRVLAWVRRTHLMAAAVAGLLSVHGILALRAAARSAAEGGGLLGAYGLIPLASGLLLGAISIASLVVARSGGNRNGE